MLKSTFFENREEDLSLEQQGGTIEERVEKLLEMKNVKDKSFNPINFLAAVDHVIEKKQKEKAQGILGLLTADMTKVLEAAIENGPLEESDVSSKDARNELVELELMAVVAGKGGEGKLSGATVQAAKLRKAAGETEKKSDEVDD
jgi:hypothetical protein